MKCWVSQSLLFVGALVLIFQQVPQANAQSKAVVCYFSSWATYRPGNGKFDIENIDPNICTHVMYAFIGLNWDSTVRIMDPWIDVELRGFQRFNDLKKKNPNLKTLIAIGGWNEGSVVFSEMARTSEKRAIFVNDVYNFIKKYGFNGLDIDWEYPAQRGGAAADKANLVSLLRELSAKLKPEGLLLTIAVHAAVSSIASSYNVPEIVKYVDFVNLMTYDYHGAWESTTGIHSPLYPSSVDTDLTLNADATVRAWLQQGAPSNKLLLGAPAFGRAYTLQSANSPGLGAVSIGPGAVGPYTQESGFMGYNELCEMQYPGGWSLNWAAQQKVPFAFRNNQWVGFESPESVRIKAEYAKSKSLGGMLVWGIETDDFKGLCGSGNFPLINTIKNSLNSPGVSADVSPATQGPWRPSTVNWFDPNSGTTTKAPTTTTRAATTTTRAATTTTRAATTTTRAATTTTRVATTTTLAPTTTTRAATTTTRAATTTTLAPTTTTRAATTTTRAATTTTRAPTTTTRAASTTQQSSSFKCTQEGYFRDPVDCSVYYYCQSNLLGGFNTIPNKCSGTLYYDPNSHICNYAYLVQC